MRRLSVSSMLMCIGAWVGMSVAPQALANTYTVSFTQSGANVVATGAGSFSVSGTTDSGSASNKGVQANNGYLILGSGENTYYLGVSGPSNFGTGGLVTPTSFTGGEVGFGLSFNEYVVPFGYVAGAALTESDTWNNTTLSGLGLTAGTYTYILGSGSTADSFIISIPSATSPTPEPGGIVLLGTGILGFAGALRKRFV